MEIKSLCPAIDDQFVFAIAAEADVCPRSVMRRLAGLPVRGRPGVRIDRALARRSAEASASASAAHEADRTANPDESETTP